MCAFDWMVFLEWIFSFHDQLNVSRIPKQARMGTKNPGFVSETGVFVEKEREGSVCLCRCPDLLVSRILRTLDACDFEAGGFHGSDEFF